MKFLVILLGLALPIHLGCKSANSSVRADQKIQERSYGDTLSDGGIQERTNWKSSTKCLDGSKSPFGGVGLITIERAVATDSVISPVWSATTKSATCAEHRQIMDKLESQGSFLVSLSGPRRLENTSRFRGSKCIVSFQEKFQLSLPPALLDDIGLSPFTQNPSGVEFIVGEADRSYCGSFKNEKFKGRRTIISNEPFTKKFNISQLRCIPPTSGGPYGSTSAQIRIATKNLGRTGDLISSELVSLRGETDCSALDRIKESVGEYGVVNISGHRNVSSHTSEFALAKHVVGYGLTRQSQARVLISTGFEIFSLTGTTDHRSCPKFLRAIAQSKPPFGII